MKKKLFIGLLMSLTIISMFAFPTYAAEAYNDETSYSYELQPGTEQWSSYKNKSDILDRLQIPEEKLNNMTTEALLETVLDYPYLLDYKFFNTSENAYDTFYNDFNGFRELVSRDDLTNVLLEKYESADVVNVAQNSNRSGSTAIEMTVEPEQFFYTSTIEFLITCDQIANGDYTTTENAILLELVNDKTTDRMETGLYSEASNVYEIFASSKVEKNSMTRAGENYSISYVYTPNGSSVQTFYNRTPELTTSEKRSCDNYVATNYPSAVKQRDATVKYNCHSYAWYSQSSSNLHWMNDPDAYMNDGSYYRYTTSPRVGMKAFWPTGDHSGIMSTITYEDGVNVFYITSKWGAYGLYKHLATNSPYSGAVHFYTSV